MSAPYAFLIFDFDGTLVDTLEDIAHHTNEVLKDNGYPKCSVEAVQRSIGLGVHELLRGVTPALAEDTQRLEKVVNEFKAAYRREPVLWTRAFPGVKETLEGPLSRTKKAIVTNKPQDITLQILDILELSECFEKVIGMHAGYPPKPDPSALNHVIRLLGGTTEKAIYIGDSPVDAETSLAASVDFAWVDYGYHALESIEPRYRFSTAKDWIQLVR